MLAIFLVILFLCALVTTHLIHRYISIKKVPIYVYIAAWVGWFMCFGIILLVPIDIIATSYRECITESSGSIEEEQNCSKPLSYLSERELYYIYQTFYFGTLILTWLVYPLLQSYVAAGDFHISERIQTSIKENVYLYLVFGVIGLIIMIWLLAVKQLDWNTMIGFVMAAANTWGLLLVIVLMGYGLVETPRSMWIQSNRELILKHLQFKAVDLQNSKKKYEEELYSTLKSIKKIQEKTRPYDPYEKYVNTIIEQCPESYKNIHSGEGTGEITYAALVSLNARLKKDKQLSQRAEFLYEQCVLEAFELQDIMASRANEDKIVHWSFKEPRQGRWKLLDKFGWGWFNYLEVPVLRLITILFVLLSIVVIWSEISVSVTSRDVSLLSNIVKHSSMSNVLIQVVVFFPLGYEALTTYSTLFKMRIFNYYRLIPHQHSDSNSIIFSAAYLCRLAAPLCFNFITFIQTQTTFSKVMGTMDVAPFLGTYFYVYFPLIIIVVCLATLFNLFSRILNFFNISRFRFDTDFNHEQIDEGKFLLESERRKWVNGKSILSSSLSSSNNSVTNTPNIPNNQNNQNNQNNNNNNGGASEDNSGSRFSNTYSKYSYLNKNSGFKNITPTSNTPTGGNQSKIGSKYTEPKSGGDDYDRDIESAITYNSNFSNSPNSSTTNNSNNNGIRNSGFPSMDRVFGKNRYSQLSKSDK